MEPDYIIIGAGSAGSLLAARLAETSANVLLLEAGPEARHPMIHIPAGVRSLHRNPALNWTYFTEPHPDTANRAIHWPRGRVIGGSGSINGMLYVRGNPGDYDAWADKAEGRNRPRSSAWRSRFRPSRAQLLVKRCASSCAQTPLPFMRVAKSAS